jgi:hypothetical protein
MTGEAKSAGSRTEQEHTLVRGLANELLAANSLPALDRVVHEAGSFLSQHFAWEERSDGPLAQAVARHPTEAWRFEEVREEHAQMLDIIDELFLLVARDDSWEASTRLAGELARRLLAHERLEAEWLRLAGGEQES